VEQIYIFSLNKKTFFYFIVINFISINTLPSITLHLYQNI